LGRLGHPSALLPLEKALSDRVFLVRIRVAYALSSLEYVPQNEPQLRRYRDALSEFRTLVGDSGLMADDGYMHLNMGQLCEFEHQYDLALQHYRYALRFTPGLAELQARMQRLLESEARYQKLVDMVTPVLKREVRAQVALGLAYIYRGQYQDGLDLLNQAKNAGIKSELIETGLGDAHRLLGQLDVAAQHYRVALGMASTFPNAHRGLSWVAYLTGDSNAGHHHWTAFVQGQADEQRVKDWIKKQ
jgi:tetratricopeptide (TPR) repeat protein